ncbi:protein ripply2 [Myripristis murdjan]|uniref:protein ripply2 n=1 Tax=Myripristis murdjan TaxID=586833 RepID=UPI001175FF04|nr:protein ripply2-like [Myripristis murdjan]
MESFTANIGLTSAFTGENVMQPKANGLWRPWAGKEDRTATDMAASMNGGRSFAKNPKTLQVTHPVKLYWPKSKCFDYLYQDAEMLLRNYPVQATICLYEDSSSDEDSEDEEEEEVEKEQN